MKFIDLRNLENGQQFISITIVFHQVRTVEVFLQLDGGGGKYSPFTQIDPFFY